MPSVRETLNALVVENDRALLRTLVEFLEGEGFRVTTEVDGRWALRTFEVRPIDLVVLDVNLPGLDGFNLAGKIQRSPKARKAKILLLSDRRHARPQREAARHGAIALLKKPVALPALRAVLRTALGSRYPLGPGSGTTELRADIEPRLDPPRDDSVSERLADLASMDERAEVEKEHGARLRPDRTARWGRIEGARFPRLLHQMHSLSDTGALYVRWEDAKKIVYLRDGRPVMVKSNLLDECLGRVMVRERMITEEECEQSLRLMRTSRRQQGTVLIEMGCISPHNLVYALDRQLRLKLYDIFSWRGGEYTFAVGVSAPHSHTGLDVSPGELIREGIYETYDHGRVVEELAPHREESVRVGDDRLYGYEDLGLAGAERAFLARLEELEGALTVAEVVRGESDLPELAHDLDGLRRAQLLLALLCSGVFVLGGRIAKTARGTPEVGTSTHREIPRIAPGGVGEADDDATPSLSARGFERQTLRIAAASATGAAPVTDPRAQFVDEADTDVPARAAGDDDDDTDVHPEVAPGARDEDADTETGPGTWKSEDTTGRRAGNILSAAAAAARNEKGRTSPPEEPAPDDLTATSPGFYPNLSPSEEEQFDGSSTEEQFDGSKTLPTLGDGAVLADDVKRELEPDTDPRRPRGTDATPGEAFVPSDTSQTDIDSHTPLAAIRRAELVRRLVRMRDRESHEVLGVRQSTTEVEIRRNYEHLASELRPERFVTATTEVRDAAREALEVVTRAHDELMHRNAVHPRRTTAELSEDVDRLLQAEREYRRGLGHLEQKRYAAGRAALQRAVELCPDEAEFHAFLGWATHCAAPSDARTTRKARASLERAARLNPKLDRTYLYCGYIHKAAGDIEAAEQDFERALQCNPDCHEALEELDLSQA